MRPLALAVILLVAPGCAATIEGSLDAGSDSSADAAAIDAVLPTDSDVANDASTAGDSNIDAPGPCDADGVDLGAGLPCGSSTCGPGEICMSGGCRGCCSVAPECIPIPTGRCGALACGCFARDPCNGVCSACGYVDNAGIHCINCGCICAAAWTPIDTPSGPRRIDDLRVGDLVFSLDRGSVAILPITRVRRQAVTHHALVRVILVGGGLVEMSGTHPTADGRSFASLRVNDHLGDAIIAAIETVPYDEPFTYDILPASDSGAYRVNGAWVGSTLFERSAIGAAKSSR